MKVLIIGGTGFIGGAISTALLGSGYEVVHFHRNRQPTETAAGLSVITGDRKDIVSFRAELMRMKPDVVIDTIAYREEMVSMVAALEGVCERLILLSSGDVYLGYSIFQGRDRRPPVGMLTERSPVREQLYPYRDSAAGDENSLLYHYEKLLVERIALASTLRVCILRLPAVFGRPGQQLSEYFGPIAAGAAEISMAAAKTSWIFTRSYVGNIAEAVRLVVAVGTWDKETYNLGDTHLPELEWLEQIRQVTQWPGRIAVTAETPDHYNYRQDIWMDASAFRGTFGYREIVSPAEAILREAYVEDARNNGCG